MKINQLLTGLREFQSTYFAENRSLFEQLGQGQSPKVLFITCSDSRIDPNLITQTDPGDLFVIRNAGNIVPPYGAANGGEGAAIEFAIHALNIEHIIVCGHNHCGAMKGLLKLNELQANMPLVYDWLKHTEATRRLVLDNYKELEGEDLLEVTAAENIITQLENLKTYPLVRSRLHQGKLDIYGWMYEIENGEVLAYEPRTQTFVSPHTELYQDSRSGHKYQPGAYLQTSAPPVVLDCDLPQPVHVHSEIERAPNSWVSIEQQNRIYGGR
jgi:carbonic anhydrase